MRGAFAHAAAQEAERHTYDTVNADTNLAGPGDVFTN